LIRYLSDRLLECNGCGLMSFESDPTDLV
jgi:hypothetical protein